MIKCIFKGDRASGKTVTLLKQASALAVDGITPVFLLTKKEWKDNLLDTAKTLKINADSFVFKTYKEFKDYVVGRDLSKIRLFIDESEAFINNLFPDIGIYLVESCDYHSVTLDRKDWDMNYDDTTSKNKEIFSLACDIDYASTSKNISLEDRLEIATVLTALGYSKTNNKQFAEKVGKHIAGHSNYNGDSILAALYAVAEGKEIQDIKPIS